MDTLALVQGSDEWRAAKAGSLGASQLHMALARVKTGWGASRASLRAQLVCERLTGVLTEGYVSGDMQRGIDMEPKARAAYAFYRDVDVAQVGLVPHPSLKNAHASPDGLVGDDGLVEIKCPTTNTHIETLLTGGVPERYVTQALWQMACTRRRWCDYVSFDDRLPDRFRLFVKRIDRNDLRIIELEKEAAIFLGEVDATVAALERLAA